MLLTYRLEKKTIYAVRFARLTMAEVKLRMLLLFMGGYVLSTQSKYVLVELGDRNDYHLQNPAPSIGNNTQGR